MVKRIKCVRIDSFQCLLNRLNFEDSHKTISFERYALGNLKSLTWGRDLGYADCYKQRQVKTP